MITNTIDYHLEYFLSRKRKRFPRDRVNYVLIDSDETYFRDILNCISEINSNNIIYFLYRKTSPTTKKDERDK